MKKKTSSTATNFVSKVMITHTLKIVNAFFKIAQKVNAFKCRRSSELEMLECLTISQK